MRWVARGIAAFLILVVVVVTLPTLARRNQERYELIAVWGNAGSGPGEFRGPIGVAVDRVGNVYVSDSGNDRIQKFGPDGAFIMEWGGTGTGSGELRRPMHIQLGPDDKLYVSEYLNDRIQVFALDGTPLGFIVSDTTTPGGALDAPAGLTLMAGGGELWIADFYNHRVAVYSTAGAYLRQIGRPGRLRSGRLHYPTDVAVHPSGEVYVADAYNRRIQRFSADGRPRGRWGGPLGLGVPGSWRGWFRVPIGLGVDGAGDLYVADFYNHRVQKFARDGGFTAEWGERGEAPGQFDRPTDVAVALDGRVYVVDFGNDRIQAFARGS